MGKKIEKIAVLGAGSWGAAIAAHLSRNGHDLSLWEFDSQQAELLKENRVLSLLPTFTIPAQIKITSQLEEAVDGREIIIFAVPSHFIRSTAQAAIKANFNPQIVISAAKGIENETMFRMSEVLEEELGINFKDKIVVLSGPSHAEEVFRQIPTAVVSASSNPKAALKAQEIFTNDFFRVYTNPDVVGVETGAALKNVIAIGCGICDGLGLGDNSKAALVTRGLQELVRLGLKMGAQEKTFFGLAGVGDLIVTCFSRHSRNRLLGEKIGQGKTLAEALGEMTMVAEGVKTAKAIHSLSKKYQLDLPISDEVYKILYEGKKPETAVRDLLTRQATTEIKNYE
ncbi:MAG: NAD(P)H-dependent glycerol-3-phosphate dehydrogenase [Elusimicrobiota bacterium]